MIVNIQMLLFESYITLFANQIFLGIVVLFSTENASGKQFMFREELPNVMMTYIR